MMGYHDMDGGWWILMWVSMMAFWVFVVLAALWLVGGVRRRDRDTAESPEELLARRLASGEIDAPRYRALRDELRARHGPSAAPP
jgi:uncharacterized membrane protein